MERAVIGVITGFELWLYHAYINPGYAAWRAHWDTTEEQDYIDGYAELCAIIQAITQGN